MLTNDATKAIDKARASVQGAERVQSESDSKRAAQNRLAVVKNASIHSVVFVTVVINARRCQLNEPASIDRAKLAKKLSRHPDD